MRSIFDSESDPSQRLVACAVCGTQVRLGDAHSVAVVYVGLDAQRRVRYTMCDEDQPFACSQEHALQAAHAYHLASHVQKRAEWQSEPDHPAIPSRLPDDDACHACGAPRDDTFIEVLVDYRVTGPDRLPTWHCPHLSCPDCLDGIVEACAREHLSRDYQTRHAAKYPPVEPPQEASDADAPIPSALHERVDTGRAG